MLMKLTPGVDLTNIFTCSFYVCIYHKHKKIVKSSVSFCALWSAHVKAPCKMLVKLATDLIIWRIVPVCIVQHNAKSLHKVSQQFKAFFIFIKLQTGCYTIWISKNTSHSNLFKTFFDHLSFISISSYVSFHRARQKQLCFCVICFWTVLWDKVLEEE